MRELKLIDDKVLINTNLTLGVLRRAQEEDLLSKDFLKNIMKLSLGASVEGANLMDDFNETDLINIVYVCYKNANPTGMGYGEFLDKMELDLPEMVSIYTEVLSSGLTKGEMTTAKNFNAVTPKQKNRSKKKYRK